jgi:hypothetical protein
VPAEPEAGDVGWAALVEEAGALTMVVAGLAEEAGGLLPPAGAWRHWLYHGLEYVQVQPDWQVVSPLKPLPPP